MAFPDDVGFVFALTYGRDVDWVKNLRASDSGSVEYGCSEIPLRYFRFFAFDEVKDMFLSLVRVFLRLLSVEDCVRAEKVIPEIA